MRAAFKETIMRNLKLASLGAGIALAAGLLAGCSTTYNPPPERVAVVAPPPAAPAAQTAAAPGGQTFQTTIGMTPLESQGIVRLQSFAGDVCMSDRDGNNGMISHCVCQQNNCSCQTTGNACP
jgi:hypothetical protein